MLQFGAPNNGTEAGFNRNKAYAIRTGIGRMPLCEECHRKANAKQEQMVVTLLTLLPDGIKPEQLRHFGLASLETLSGMCDRSAGQQ